MALQLITNESKKSFKPSCVVKLSNEVDKFNDFIAVGHNDMTEETVLLQNASALTIGKAAQMILRAFNDAMRELTPDERAFVYEQLGGGVIL